MRELGVDLSDRVPRRLTRELAEQADVVVTMGCGDECPYIPGKRYVDWELDDPAGRPVDEVRATRDDIARRVRRTGGRARRRSPGHCGALVDSAHGPARPGDRAGVAAADGRAGRRLAADLDGGRTHLAGVVADRTDRDGRRARGRALRPGTARCRPVAVRAAGVRLRGARARAARVRCPSASASFEHSILHGVHAPLPFGLSWRRSRSAGCCSWPRPWCSSAHRSDGASLAVRSAGGPLEPGKAGSSTVVTRHPPAAPQAAVSDHYRAARVIGPVLARIVRLSSSAIAGSIARSGPRRVQQRPANHAT